jgi:hypothetical protein
MRPFKVTFKTDSSELSSSPTTTATDPTVNESAGLNFGTGGIVGFSLNYFQVSC